MRITPISQTAPLKSITSVGSSVSKGASAEDSGSVSFSEMLKNGINEVNKIQNQADNMAVQMASGDIEDVHKAMIAMNKAKLAFDFTVQVRNKVIDAYQEIMRMQV